VGKRFGQQSVPKDSPECDGGFRLPSLLFLPKQPSADGTKTDRLRHGGAFGL